LEERFNVFGHEDSEPELDSKMTIPVKMPEDVTDN